MCQAIKCEMGFEDFISTWLTIVLLPLWLITEILENGIYLFDSNKEFKPSFENSFNFVIYDGDNIHCEELRKFCSIEHKEN